MNADRPKFSSEVAKAGREGIAIRDIQGFLRHRSEIAPTTGLREYNLQTMIGALQIASIALGEIDPRISPFPRKGIDDKGIMQRVRNERFSTGTGNDGATVFLEYGRIGLTEQEEREARERNAANRIDRITEDDYHRICSYVVPVPGREDAFTVMIDGQLIEALPSPNDGKFGTELMSRIKKVNPKWEYKTISVDN